MRSTFDSDSDDELPPAWEERATSEGHVYYVNHQSKTTQWTHPRTSKTKKVSGSLPYGWVKKIEEGTGKILFIDHENKITTYTDPRLAFAVEDNTKLEDIRQKYDSGTTALQILHGRDLTGKVAIVTGANSGIGYETARSLVFHGCKVIFACRNEKLTNAAIKRITTEKSVTEPNCVFIKLDLQSLKSTKEFVDHVKMQYRHIDYLILNAAIFGIPYNLTPDGLESMFQINYLSQFYLTTEMKDLFNHKTRIVIVSSESHRYPNFTEDTQITELLLSPNRNKYRSFYQYNNTKLYNLLWARELGMKWKQDGITVFALHPGNLVSSNLSRNWWIYRLLFFIVRPFTKSLQQAASTTIYCATAPELTGMTGIYFNNCFFCKPSNMAIDDKLSDQLWTLSEAMIKRILSEN